MASRLSALQGTQAILCECADRDYKVNPVYTKKAFKVIRRDVDNIYLDETQIQALMDTELSPSHSKQQDIFVAACSVGVRFSDWHQIRQDNIFSESKKSRYKNFG